MDTRIKVTLAANSYGTGSNVWDAYKNALPEFDLITAIVSVVAGGKGRSGIAEDAVQEAITDLLANVQRGVR